MSDDDFKGLDFHPDIGEKEKKKAPKRHTISVSIGLEAQVFLNHLLSDRTVNVSRFIENLVLMAKQHQDLGMHEYFQEGIKYKECTLLLREEVADFIESWLFYGIIGNLSINSGRVARSTPLQIGRKISFLLANDNEFRLGDSNIYGYLSSDIEQKFNTLKEKTKQVPKEYE